MALTHRQPKVREGYRRGYNSTRRNAWPLLISAATVGQVAQRPYRPADTAEVSVMSNRGERFSPDMSNGAVVCTQITPAILQTWTCGIKSRRTEKQGRSLILARTEHGEVSVKAAVIAGLLNAEERQSEILFTSQTNLLNTLGAVWGRRHTCRLIGAGSPRQNRLHALHFWLTELTLGEKVRSVLGTIRGVFVPRRFPRLLTPASQRWTMSPDADMTDFKQGIGSGSEPRLDSPAVQDRPSE